MTRSHWALLLLIGCVAAVAIAAAAVTYERYDTKTLKRTVRRDAVQCGVNTGLPGFSVADDKGNWSGFDVDFCRAIAAAIFDDPKKVKFIPLDAKERFDELGKRKVDVLARNSTWTMSRLLVASCKQRPINRPTDLRMNLRRKPDPRRQLNSP